jgi:hypothetical protein
MGSLGVDGINCYFQTVTSNEQVVLKTLVELEARVAHLAAHKSGPSLLPLFDQLRQLTHDMPPSTDPTLLHYLHKQSWQKARLWLEGREAENVTGSCGHV